MTGLDAILIVLGVTFLAGMIRAGLGPSPADRAVGSDLCFLSVVATLAVLAGRFDETRFFDAVVIATLLGFIATISLARLLERRK